MQTFASIRKKASMPGIFLIENLIAIIRSMRFFFCVSMYEPISYSIVILKKSITKANELKGLEKW